MLLTKRGTRLHLTGRRLAACALVTALTFIGLGTLTPVASATQYCGSSQFVEKIEVVQWADGQFQIQLTPTYDARVNAAISRTPRDAVVEQWHAIQACVPGLYGALADTIWDQLECHQLNSAIIWKKEDGWWLTGSTYDLESWRPTLPRWLPGQSLILTECLNNLGVDPAGPFGSPIRPDAGQADLFHAFDNIA